MIKLYRDQLAMWRMGGFEIFVIPGPGEVTGIAFSEPETRPGRGDQKTRLHITITGSTYSPIWLFVLFHEIVHHLANHTTQWSSVPSWQKEYHCDHDALELIKMVQPYAAARCERASKEHIRPLLQAIIDIGITHHVDLTIAEWAGCHVPLDMRAELEAFAPGAGAGDEGLVF